MTTIQIQAIPTPLNTVFALAVLLSAGFFSATVAAEKQIYYIHNDHLATPQLVTDGNQNVVWDAHYQPFGQATVDEDVDGNGQQLRLNLRFPGQYFDPESGLHYNYFRDYDPSTGRYVQSDPIGLDGGLNTYVYVENNPLSYVDPDGLRRVIRNPLREREFWENVGTVLDHASRALYGADCVWVCPNDNGQQCTAADPEGDGRDSMKGPFLVGRDSDCYCQNQLPSMIDFHHPPNTR